MSAPLPARVRHGYGVAALSLALANTSAMFFLLKMLVDDAGLSPATAGGVILVGKLWDAVSDPLVGRWTDRTRTRMGARRPWMAGATVPFALAFGALWWGLPWTGTAAALAYATLYLAYNTAYTAVVVPYGALTPSLTTDPDETTRLHGTRMAWSMIGGLVAAILMPTLHAATGSWRVPGLVIAAAMVPPLAVCVAATAGRDVTPPSDPEARPLDVLRVPAFRRVAGAFLAAWTSLAILGALVPFHVQHHIGRPDRLDAVLAVLQIAGLAAIPLVVRLASRTSKARAYTISMASFAALLLLMAGLPPGQLGATLSLGVLAGFGVAGAHVLPWAMLPDVVAADRAATGHDRSGSFYGMMTFLEKMATAFALGGVGFALEAAGYVQGAATQSPAAIDAVRWLLGPLPAVLLGLGVIALRAAPSDRRPHPDAPLVPEP